MTGRYRVSIVATRTHEYVVDDARSPEHAEAIAEQWFEEGEDGNVTATDVDSTEALPEDEADAE